MKEELKIGDLIKIDDEYRSTMKAMVMGSMMATETVMETGTVIHVTNYTKCKNGIALVVDVISNREYYKHESYDIFKIILNSEVRYLYRVHIQHAKKVS